MTQWRVLPADARRRMRWKNGRGSTLELCSDAPASDPVAWSWRLSIADVPDAGPFSRFEGVDRWIARVDGRGMRVCVDERWHVVPASGAALAFAGESQTRGEPEGDGVRDANLMVVRRAWHGALQVLEAGEPHVPALAGGAPAHLVAVHALDADGVVAVGEALTPIKSGETVLASGLALQEGVLQVRSPSGRFLVAFLRPRAAD